MSIIVPEQQLFDRWDVLPMVLKEAIASEANSDFVWKAAESEHLSKEKIKIVSKLAGYVLSGFLHPEDLADEIKTELSINPNIAGSIATALNARIFSPLRADLDKIYAPAVPETELPRMDSIRSASSGQVSSPQILEETGKPEPVSPVASAPPATAPVPPKNVPTVPLDATQGKPSGATPSIPSIPAPKIIPMDGFDSSTPLTAAKPTANNIPQAPASFTPSKAGGSPVPSAAPKPSEVTTPKPIEVPSAKPAAPSPATTSGPIIIHQESQFAPIRQSSGFKLDIPIPDARGGKPQWTAPPKPAQIEMGSIPTPAAKTPTPPAGKDIPQSSLKPFAPSPRTSESEPRMVHYNQLKTPLDIARDKTLPQTPPKANLAVPPKPMPPAGGPVESSIFAPVSPFIPAAPKPGQELKTKRQDIISPSPKGVFDRVKEKIFPARKFLPDPLKEPELQKPEEKSK